MVQYRKHILMLLFSLSLGSAASANWTKFLEDVPEDQVAQDDSNDSSFIEKKFKKAGEFYGNALSALDRLPLSIGAGKSLDVLQALRISAKYKYKAEPADIGKYFARIDSWELKAAVSPGDYLDSLKDFFVNFSMEPGVKVTFVQLYDSVKDARNLKNGYSPGHLPLTAERALKNLNPGDLAIFEGNMSFLVGAGEALSFLSDKINLNASVGAQITGDFKVFVFRGSDSIVRLRVAALRSRGKSIEVKFGVEDLIDAGPHLVKKSIARWLDADELFKLGARRANQDIYLGDYTLDLSNPEVVTAYNNLFSRARRLRSLEELSNPFTKDENLRKKLVSNLDELNELAREDYELDDKRVRANFRGTSYSEGLSKFFDFNLLKMFGVETNYHRSDNKLSEVLTLPTGDEIQRYFFPSWSNNQTTSVFFNWLKKEKDEKSTNIIYETDENFKITKFHSIGFYRDIFDNRYLPYEHNEVLQTLFRILPKAAYDELVVYLEKNKWFKLEHIKDNVRVSTRYFLHETGLKALENTPEKNIEEYIVNIIQKIDATGFRPYSSINRKNNGTSQFCKTELLVRFGIPSKNELRPGNKMVRFCNKIIPLAQALADAVDTGRSKMDRHLSFVSLEKNALFHFLGPSIILELIPKAANGDPSDLAFFEIVIAARDLENPLLFRYGNLKNRELYEKILEIQKLLNDELPDLRIPSDKESKTEKAIQG